MIAPNRADLVHFLDMVFGYVDHGEENHAYCIAMRGIGEKGTSGEGGFMNPIIMPPIRSELETDIIFGHVQRWSSHQRASFIVPAAISPRALSDGKATEDRIQQFTTVCVDLDKGETEKALAHAIKHLGQASMVVHSGGITEAEHPKMHVYWRLSEPTDEVARVGILRKTLALKLGGDTSFARVTQVIRMPGSIYSKSGVERPCWIASRSTSEYELAELGSALSDMPVLEGIQLDAGKLTGAMPTIYATGAGLNFSAFKSAKLDIADEKPSIGTSLTTDIKEGGDVDRSRWGEFNRVAGLNIKQARDGLITMDDARGLTHAWMMLHMKPPFPPLRFESEFNGLAKADARNHGPLIEAKIVNLAEKRMANPNISPPMNVVEGLDGTHSLPLDLEDWDYSKWNDEETPVRKFLVPGLIQAGKSHLLAAEGGAGKTFMLLDLAIKIAMHRPEDLQSWCGLPLADDAGGLVVMLTTEDDEEEIKIRMATLIDKGQRDELKRRKLLKIVPTTNAGGAFPLVERQRAQGPARTSERWKVFLDQFRKFGNLKLVVIDTLNSTMHGEENSATAINEYVQAATSVVCGELGAALVVTHHIRKPGANIKIYTPEDMKAAIRGSSAIIAAFRAVIGLWAAPDYKSRLGQMALPPKRGQLYNLAVLKANNPEMAYDMRAMLRQPNGLLSDITDQEKTLVAGAQSELSAWIVKAAEYAADKGHPFSVKAMERRPPNGRRHQLPPPLQELTERDVKNLCERLIEDGQLVQCNPAGQKTYNYLDIPTGPLARSDAAEDGTLYKVSGGKDFTPPDWLKLFAYHLVEQRIVPRGTELDRTHKQGSRKPVEPRRKGPFNPNKDAQQNVPQPVAPATPEKETALGVGGGAGFEGPSADAQTSKPVMRFSPDCSMETKTS